MIIILETLIALISILLIIVFFRKKGIKECFKISAIIGVLFIICILVTIIFEKPQIESLDVLNIEVKSTESLKVPKVTYMFQDVSKYVKIVGDIDYNKVGKYEIEYEVPMLFGKYSEKQIVNIVDNTPPVITLGGGDEVNCSYKKEYEELRSYCN